MLEMRRLLVPAALLAMWPTVAGASSIPITNPGFEDPAVPTFTFTGAPGWIVGGSGGGVWNINASPLGFWTATAPEGDQVGWLAPAFGPGSPADYTQTLAASFQLNTAYSLTGYVGHPQGFGASIGTAYTVALLAGGNLLASFSSTGPEGSFSPFAFTFTASGSPYVGQPLGIRLSTSQEQTAFDAIALDATATVPEPSSVLFVASGLGTLLARRRRRSGRV
jgi:hypothetical protein